MPERYFCRAGHRRDLVRAATDGDGLPFLNGIDYVEIADDQSTIRVVFLHAVPGEADAVPGPPAEPLTADNFRLEGGVRITGVRIESATVEERTVSLAVDRAGDFSPYTLHLVAGPTATAPPEGFDPQLAEVDFSFKVDCPTGLDCAPVEECPPGSVEEPLIDYLARDYASFRRLMLDRLAVTLPEWTERSPADLGVTVVELLAAAADHLSYYQDAVATEAYLGTARRRVSVRRHARLLDYLMHEGANARAWICLEVEGAGGAIALPAAGLGPGRRTRFLSRCVDSVVVNPSDLDDIVARFAPAVFEPLHDALLYPSHNEIRFHTWGATECCLPRGATRAALRDDPAARLRLRGGDVLMFEEVVNPEHPEVDADPAKRHVVRLTRVRPEAELDPGAADPRVPASLLVDPLTGEAYVEIEWDAADALPHPLCLSAERDGVPVPDISVARGNVVLADHGRTLAERPLAVERGPRFARARIPEPHVVHRVPFDPDAASAEPAARASVQDPRAALPALVLDPIAGAPEPWEPVRDLLDSDPFGRHVVVEMEEDGTAHLRFGDGRLGRRPHGDFRATYRVARPGEGDVGAEVLAHAVTDVAAIQRVRNPLPAAGATRSEPLEAVRLHAPHAFRSQERAVTEADYGEVARRHPDVQHARATLRWTGSWHTMFVTVDRLGGRPVDAAFVAELRDFIGRFRLAGHDVQIEPPRFVPLDLALTVCVDADHFLAAVRADLLDAFSTRDLPGGRRGFFHPDNLTFGEPLYLSRLVSAVLAVPGVLSVDVDETPPKPNRFRRWGEPSHGEVEEGLIRVGRLEIIRVDNDPNAAENGSIRFHLKGGR